MVPNYLRNHHHLQECNGGEEGVRESERERESDAQLGLQDFKPDIAPSLPSRRSGEKSSFEKKVGTDTRADPLVM